MDSTHGISDPLSTSTTSVSKFTAGSTFEAQLAKSTGLFTTDLFGHSGADAFKRILIKHARRTAGVDLDFDRQYYTVSERGIVAIGKGVSIHMP